MLELLVTAAVSCSAGFVLSGLMTAAKVTAFYERIAITEKIIEDLNDHAREFANAMRMSLGSIEGRMVARSDAEALSGPQGVLAKYDAFLCALESTREDAA